jgi:predicted TIM-barrel fold metal-dependent hydrolase
MRFIFANHAHVFPKGLFPQGTIEDLLLVMDECYIEKAVVFAPFHSQVLQLEINPNRWLAEAIKLYEDRLVGFGVVNMESNNIEEQVREIYNLGLKGIKLHPSYQKFNIVEERAFKVYRIAEELRLFISFHTGIHWHRIKDTHVLLFDEVAFSFPNLRFSLEHVGGYSFFKDAVGVIMNNMKGHRSNIYAGLTSVFNKKTHPQWYLSLEQIKELVEIIGDTHILFGLDFPYNQTDAIKEAIDMLNNSGLSKETLDRILGGNMELVISETRL